MILPGAAYTEKNGLYVNTEGRVQQGVRAVFPKGEAKEGLGDPARSSERLGRKLPLRQPGRGSRAKLFADHPTFGRIDHVDGPDRRAPGSTCGALGGKGELTDAPFASAVAAFYLTNAIARASVTMAECAALASGAAEDSRRSSMRLCRHPLHIPLIWTLLTRRPDPARSPS